MYTTQVIKGKLGLKWTWTEYSELQEWIPYCVAIYKTPDYHKLPWLQ